MKTVEAMARFQEIQVNNYTLEVTEQATASNFKAAASKAFGLILKNPNLKRKRFTTVSLELVVIPRKD